MIVYVSIMSLINGLSSDEWGQLLVTVMFFYLIIYCVIAYQNEYIINIDLYGGTGLMLVRKTDSPFDYWFNLILMSSLAVAVNVDIWFFKDPSFVSLLLNQNK